MLNGSVIWKFKKHFQQSRHEMYLPKILNYETCECCTDWAICVFVPQLQQPMIRRHCFSKLSDVNCNLNPITHHHFFYLSITHAYSWCHVSTASCWSRNTCHSTWQQHIHSTAIQWATNTENQFVTYGQKVLPNAPVFKITFQCLLICDIRSPSAIAKSKFLVVNIYSI